MSRLHLSIPTKPQTAYQGSVARGQRDKARAEAAAKMRETTEALRREVYGVASIADVITVANKMAGVDLRIHNSAKDVFRYRAAAYAVARKLTGKSYPQIAKAFGRDHSTVIYGCSRAEPEVVKTITDAVLGRKGEA